MAHDIQLHLLNLIADEQFRRDRREDDISITKSRASSSRSRDQADHGLDIRRASIEPEIRHHHLCPGMREAWAEGVGRHEHGFRPADDHRVELRGNTGTQLSRQRVGERPHADGLAVRAPSKQLQQDVVE
jgi:hypothetical protein